MEKDYNLGFEDNVQNARGTIHHPAISQGFSLPLDPTEATKELGGTMPDDLELPEKSIQEIEEKRKKRLQGELE